MGAELASFGRKRGLTLPQAFNKTPAREVTEATTRGGTSGD
jgi:hypothetical protein